MTRRIRILLADDQEMMRAGFRMILQTQADFEVVGEAADGFEAVELAARLAPDVVVMDVRMPRLDGVEATRRMRGRRVLILTTFDLDEYLVEGLRAGASGFLLKDAPPGDLVRAIRVIAAGDALLAPSATRRLLDRVASRLDAPSREPPAVLATLTEREREVLLLVARGLTNGEIANHLFVSDATVKTHVSHLLQKLSLRDRIQAVVFAYDAGIVRPGA